MAPLTTPVSESAHQNNGGVHYRPPAPGIFIFTHRGQSTEWPCADRSKPGAGPWPLSPGRHQERVDPAQAAARPTRSMRKKKAVIRGTESRVAVRSAHSRGRPAAVGEPARFPALPCAGSTMEHAYAAPGRPRAGVYRTGPLARPSPERADARSTGLGRAPADPACRARRPAHPAVAPDRLTRAAKHNKKASTMAGLLRFHPHLVEAGVVGGTGFEPVTPTMSR